jgi:hypothetical protein
MDITDAPSTRRFLDAHRIARPGRHRTGWPVTVAPYPEANVAKAPQDVHDVDSDGRPDLLLSSPWGFVDSCGQPGIEHPGPSPAARALPGGRFSLDDAATRAWLRAQCTAREPDAPPDVFDIACGRLAGLDPEGLVAALVDHHPTGPQRLLGYGLDDRCMTFQQLAAQSLIGFGVGPASR